jgi:dTDP-4-amino-4,6-dideoxygalactose transaminase
MHTIAMLAQEYGFRVIEDASHAIGALHNMERVGSCRWSDITVFSFHPVKIITSAEGGMALTNNAEIAEHMRLMRSHGITRDSSKFVNCEIPPPSWMYEQHYLGYNYRMTDIQAALGLSQLSRLAEFLNKRNAFASRYNELLQNLPLQLPVIQKGNYSAFHLYVVRIKLLLSKTTDFRPAITGIITQIAFKRF